ncbi:hypothetical protein SASPL_134951 [Salvia splendens]|uniref:Uncharacterized protein n=1 Tax=Salvia splendens TaxID=180675 RepID=A0A8X8WYP5_SALSN|nr:hypothetical protein SASPL_134951 [Salvia splendens]
MERIPELHSVPRLLPVANKARSNLPTLLKEEIRKPSRLRDPQELDSHVPAQAWKGKSFLQEDDDDEELMPDVLSFTVGDDSFEEPGSTSFHGVSHPPEPVDMDMMRPVYMPIGRNKNDAKCLAKSFSKKGPYLEDLSLRVPPSIKQCPPLLSPAESLVEEHNDLAAISSPFAASRPSQNTEASPLPESEEKECVWDASLPPSGNVSPLSSIDSVGVARAMSIANSCASTYRKYTTIFLLSVYTSLRQVADLNAKFDFGQVDLASSVGSGSKRVVGNDMKSGGKFLDFEFF